MDSHAVRSLIEGHLQVLVEDIGPRPAGSPANRRATDHLSGAITRAGLPVRAVPFRTRWWTPGPTRLRIANGGWIELQANPFSPAGTVSGPIRRFDDRADLLSAPTDAGGEVIVLGPSLGGEPVFPATFPFLQVPEHRELVAALAARSPVAVVAISDRHASIPTFEDPTLPFPSLTVSPEVGDLLAPGGIAELEVAGSVQDGQGVTLSVPTVPTGPRVVLSAHVDAKVTTPGAFDNAASVAVLCTLLEVAADELGPVEVVFFNGEDHHDNAGEQAWLAATDLGDVMANVNLDGAGVVGRRTGVTCLACPDDLEAQITGWADSRPGWTTMPPWYESDHAIFAMRGIPSVAITSEGVHDLLTEVAHTAADTLDMLDLDVLVDLVDGLHELVPRLTRR